MRTDLGLTLAIEEDVACLDVSVTYRRRHPVDVGNT